MCQVCLSMTDAVYLQNDDSVCRRQIETDAASQSGYEEQELASRRVVKLIAQRQTCE